MLLDGRTVLITGAGQGMGRGIAQALVEEGARVVVTDLRASDVDRTASEIGARARSLALDVTDPGRIESVIAEVGTLDGIVNNAGFIAMASAIETSLSAWQHQFDVNTAGLFSCCQAFARHVFNRSGTGSIVNIASNAGKVGYANMTAYNASKAGVISITRTLAMEWAPSINVNAVCPGGVATPMLEAVAEWIGALTGDDVGGLYAAMTPHQLGRHIEPIEVGRIVAFLLSDRAQIIRGQSISIDGGDTPW